MSSPVLAKRRLHACRRPCGPVVRDSPPHKGVKFKVKIYSSGSGTKPQAESQNGDWCGITS